MAKNSMDSRMAIFLAAVCSQTYAQYRNPDGTFIVPKSYRVVSVFKALSYNDKVEWFGFILESDDSAIIAFRGTSSAADWISDSIARQEKFKWVWEAGWTHAGFTKIYSSARPQIISALNSIAPHKTLYVTGHSLGGALATLCAVDVAANTGFRNPHVYTYGSPRVGDAKFAGAFDEKIAYSYRVHNKSDVVPHLPPIVYKQPRSSALYYYIHVKEGYKIEFKYDSVSGNHVLGSYFEELAKRDPEYTEVMCGLNPGMCPTSE